MSSRKSMRSTATKIKASKHAPSRMSEERARPSRRSKSMPRKLKHFSGGSVAGSVMSRKSTMSMMSKSLQSISAKSVLRKIGKIGNRHQNKGHITRDDIAIHEVVDSPPKEVAVVNSPKISYVDRDNTVSLVEKVFWDMADELCKDGFENTTCSSMWEISREDPRSRGSVVAPVFMPDDDLFTTVSESEASGPEFKVKVSPGTRANYVDLLCGEVQPVYASAPSKTPKTSKPMKIEVQPTRSKSRSRGRAQGSRGSSQSVTSRRSMSSRKSMRSTATKIKASKHAPSRMSEERARPSRRSKSMPRKLKHFSGGSVAGSVISRKSTMSMMSKSKKSIPTKSVRWKIGTKIGNHQQDTPNVITIHETVGSPNDVTVVNSPKTSYADRNNKDDTINATVSLVENVFYDLADELCTDGFDNTSCSSMSEISREHPRRMERSLAVH